MDAFEDPVGTGVIKIRYASDPHPTKNMRNRSLRTLNLAGGFTAPPALSFPDRIPAESLQIPTDMLHCKYLATTTPIKKYKLQ